ncbi:MAG TPA: alpha-ketoacid dehydrogenase subunit beta [Acidobacteriota bacterium]|nr:alpha-ketoacid dehydrogenase subunit beta [Acidobacteriota bacterium]
MPDLNMAQAINRTLCAEMRRDEAIVLLGEEVGSLGGLFGTSEGLLDEFGDRRVVDAPVAEGGVIGSAVGMALYGLRPVTEIQFADFVWPGFEHIVSEMAKVRYRSGGQYSCPLVLRLPYGGGVGGGMYQSQSPEAYFCHTPGLVVGAPSDAADAAGMLRSALRGDDPVVLLEPKRLYRDSRASVDDDHLVPFGEARVRRQGSDVSVFAYGSTVPIALQAAEAADELGIQIDVVDLRTLLPLDIATVLGSIAKTGRAVIVAESPTYCGYGAELSATLSERALLHLEAPIERVAGFDLPVPYFHEDDYLPSVRRVVAAIERVANF